MSDKEKMVMAFSPSTEMWAKQDFRELVDEMVKDVTGTTLYMITTNNDSDFIERVRKESGMEVEDVSQVVDNDALIAKLVELKVSIFLGDVGLQNREINGENSISLKANNVTGTQAINIISLVDTNKNQPKYITHLSFWTDQINQYKDGKEDPNKEKGN